MTPAGRRPQATTGRTKVTTPVQAGSPRALDSWQRDVESMLRVLDNPRFDSWETCQKLRRRLRKLRRSMELAERR